MKITIDTDIQTPRWHDAIDGISGEYLRNIVVYTLEHIPYFQKHAPEEIEVSYVFTDDAMITQLNKDHRGKDRPTNVLSFPQIDWDDMHIQLPLLNIGDEVLAFETIEREAHEQEKTFRAHTTHMIVHGLLHLCGYDHIEPEEAEAMEALEVEILNGLSIKNPYQN